VRTSLWRRGCGCRGLARGIDLAPLSVGVGLAGTG